MINEHIARVDGFIATYLGKLDHARKHGGNVKKWQHKIDLLVSERNKYMLIRDALPEGKAPAPSDKVKFRFVRPVRSFKRFGEA